MIGKMLDLAEPFVTPARFAEAHAELEKFVTSNKQAGRDLVERVEREVSAEPSRAFRFDAHGFTTLTAAGHEWAAGRLGSAAFASRDCQKHSLQAHQEPVRAGASQAASRPITGARTSR